MSPLPPTPSNPLDVPATPETAIPESPLGKEAEALPTTAVGTEKRAAHLVMAAVPVTKKHGTAELYFQQVYKGEKKDLYFVTSLVELKSLLAGFSSVERLVLLSHATPSALQLEKQYTAQQLSAALQESAGAMPTIGTLTIDGCSIGQDPAGLFAMVGALPISKIEAWTYFHHFEVWGRPSITPDPTENLEAVLEFAAPYVPLGTTGRATTAAQLQAEFDETGTFEVMTEFFTYNLDSELDFEVLTAEVGHAPTGSPLLLPEPWTRVRKNSEAQFPRSAVEDALVDSVASAGARADVVKADEAAPYRVIVTK